MSVEALSWVLNKAEVTDALEAMILVGIANHTNHDGTGCRAGQALLAKYARCSARTVRRKLVDLETRGVIRRGDQQAVDHIPQYLRPVVWDLVMTPPDTVSGGLPPDTAMSAPPGHSYVRTPRTRMSYQEPSEEPSVEPSGLTSPSRSKKGPVPVPHGFDYFWSLYPRKERKLKALDAFRKALDHGADPSHIAAGASRYANDPNRSPRFTALAATWLNGGGWEDAPLPDRHEHRDRQSGILAHELEAARAADAAELFALEEGGRG